MEGDAIRAGEIDVSTPAESKRGVKALQDVKSGRIREVRRGGEDNGVLSDVSAAIMKPIQEYNKASGKFGEPRVDFLDRLVDEMARGAVEAAQKDSVRGFSINGGLDLAGCSISSQESRVQVACDIVDKRISGRPLTIGHALFKF